MEHLGALYVLTDIVQGGIEIESQVLVVELVVHMKTLLWCEMQLFQPLLIGTDMLFLLFDDGRLMVQQTIEGRIETVDGGGWRRSRNGHLYSRQKQDRQEQ